jgi:hypothetical protein
LVDACKNTQRVRQNSSFLTIEHKFSTARIKLIATPTELGKYSTKKKVAFQDSSEHYQPFYFYADKKLGYLKMAIINKMN